jgi:hypothetical protein
MKRVFQKTVPMKFQVLEEFDQNIFEYSHLKEQNILNNMRDHPALHDGPFENYKHEKTQKPLKTFSPCFSDAYILFFHMTIFKNIFVKLF